MFYDTVTTLNEALREEVNRFKLEVGHEQDELECIIAASMHITPQTASLDAKKLPNHHRPFCYYKEKVFDIAVKGIYDDKIVVQVVYFLICGSSLICGWHQVVYFFATLNCFGVVLID